MAKDDYFVISYRILAYLYACMKSGEKPDISNISYEKLKIHQQYWIDVLESLCDEGYIKNIGFHTYLGGNVNVDARSVKITQSGIQFLNENSCMNRAKELLKDLKEIIPGL